MVKKVGAGVDRGLEMISAVWAGGGTSDKVMVSASIRRSLLARCRARFSAEAAGMMWQRLRTG